MSLRLALASIHVPRSLLARELDEVARRTTEGLDGLLCEYDPGGTGHAWAGVTTPATMDSRRATMARTHNAQVARLVQAVGRGDAVRIGRERMHQVGLALGRDAKERLGVGDDLADLFRAARIMYRVLGIDFEVERRGSAVTMRVSRCALSRDYSADACLVLSATDEGVVAGLSEGTGMRFSQRIACGAGECVADITLGGGEGQCGR